MKTGEEMFKLDSSFDLLIEKLVSWYEIFIKKIPNFIVAVFILFLFITLAKYTRTVVSKLLPKVSKNRSVNSLLETISFFTIFIIGIFTSLEVLGLEKTVTSILAGAGVIGLALGFAFQEIASNFVSGIFIAIKEPYQIGDIVEVESYTGTVKNIELRTTCLTTFDGLEVYIPNKDMFTKPIINYTSTPNRRVDVPVGVSYGDDLEKVEKVVREAVEKIEGRNKTKDIEIFYNEFGDSSINLTARIWIDFSKPIHYLSVKHDAIMNIKKAFDAHDITIPFPIRTLDFGVKGGIPLNQMLIKKQGEDNEQI